MKTKILKDGTELRAVQGYPGIYATKDGRVYDDNLKRFRKQSKNGGGYMVVGLTDDKGRHRVVGVHRVIIAAWDPAGLLMPVVAHIDDDPTNNRLENLLPCTQKMNCNIGRRNSLISMKVSAYKQTEKGRREHSEAMKKGHANRKKTA